MQMTTVQRANAQDTKAIFPDGAEAAAEAMREPISIGGKVFADLV